MSPCPTGIDAPGNGAFYAFLHCSGFHVDGLKTAVAGVSVPLCPLSGMDVPP